MFSSPSGLSCFRPRPLVNPELHNAPFTFDRQGRDGRHVEKLPAFGQEVAQVPQGRKGESREDHASEEDNREVREDYASEENRRLPRLLLSTPYDVLKEDMASENSYLFCALCEIKKIKQKGDKIKDEFIDIGQADIDSWAYDPQ
uniref:Uncharacterized protein n=1 Tax=Steinernema glaseri TaxID=37863 RepID=A0A1I7YPP8_9BILA